MEQDAVKYFHNYGILALKKCVLSKNRNNGMAVPCDKIGTC